VKHAAHAPPGARLIKLADKTVNLRDLAEAPPADWPACAAANTSTGLPAWSGACR
jgi:hypothetical protein